MPIEEDKERRFSNESIEISDKKKGNCVLSSELIFNANNLDISVDFQ